MSRIFANLPLKTLQDILKSANDDQTLLRTLIEELSLRKDPASLRLLNEANKRLNTQNITPQNSNVLDKNNTCDSNEKTKFKSRECPECKTPYKSEKIESKYKFSYCENPNCNRIYLTTNNMGLSSSYYYENTDKDGIICIDFGTSSIRASYASHDGTDNQPLSFGSKLGVNEDYYLDSKVFIADLNSAKVFLSQTAESENSLIRSAAYLYSTSPKSWITTHDFSEIESPLSPTSKVSRKTLLSLLLSLAIKGIRLELNLTLDELLNYEIRLSHPVWENSSWAKKKLCMEEILHDAIYLSEDIAQGLGFKEIDALLTKIPQFKPLYNSIDVVEPIAAAVELFKNTPGYRQICAVIDIGAGTTDLGLFSSITPDSPSYLNGDGTPIKKLFKSLAFPISLQKAGDHIDAILTDIYSKKYSQTLTNNQIRSVQQQMRNRKPALFEDDEIYIGDIRISLDELVKHCDTVIFVDEIIKAFLSLIKAAEDEIEKQYNLNVNYIRVIDLIFAGGGHQINFIRKAIPSSVSLRNQKIKIQIQDIDLFPGISLVDYSRLSASLGGSCSCSQWPTINPIAKNYGALDFKFNSSPFPNRL
jgi:hypothetical protein